jgi:hypothetical protein
MKIAAAALILCLIPPQDAQKSKDPDVRRVTLKADNWPIGKVVADLQKQSDIPIEYDPDVKKDLEKSDATVSILVADIVLTGALRLVFESRGYKVVVIDKKKVLIAKQ